jgi:hypothetical protein
MKIEKDTEIFKNKKGQFEIIEQKRKLTLEIKKKKISPKSC